MLVHLVDGTYELFRYFLAPAAFDRGAPSGLRAVRGVVGSILGMLEGGATHVGVATDHVIESFRNGLWPGYKTSEGVDPALLAQFEPLEEALRSLGVVVWAMVELEADDALASAARIAAADPAVEQICIWSPDKDLAQCVRGDRIVMVDRKGEKRNEAGVREKYGVGGDQCVDRQEVQRRRAIDQDVGNRLPFDRKSADLLERVAQLEHAVGILAELTTIRT